jgi:hypothetical protein
MGIGEKVLLYLFGEALSEHSAYRIVNDPEK